LWVPATIGKGGVSFEVTHAIGATVTHSDFVGLRVSVGYAVEARGGGHGLRRISHVRPGNATDSDGFWRSIQVSGIGNGAELSVTVDVAGGHCVSLNLLNWIG
jgi:hypothetical protein